jgi:hypothetical protein
MNNSNHRFFLVRGLLVVRYTKSILSRFFTSRPSDAAHIQVVYDGTKLRVESAVLGRVKLTPRRCF